MSWQRTVELTCDRCGVIFSDGCLSVIAARKWAAAEGWTLTAGRDRCLSCTAEEQRLFAAGDPS